jgi:tetratricopeptide (TPR) repeat protein
MKQHSGTVRQNESQTTICLTLGDENKTRMRQKLSELSEEAKRLLTQRRYTAVLMTLLEIVTLTQELREDPVYAALQADALSWIGFVYRQLHRYDEAEAYIDEAIEILEELYDKHRRFGGQLAKAYINDAAYAMDIGDETYAREIFKDALTVAKEEHKEPCLYVDVLYEGALLFGDLTYIEEAKQVVHLCDEKKERLWIKKLNRLEKRLQKRQRVSGN